ncbi:MAG: hypothetical protein OXF01_12230 [Gemmatimonadetes bacterium]|nr:hypothetical protein [Gemmatimonadota bacterium]
MRHAPRRSWRIGHTEPVQVVFVAYRNTPPAEALKLGVQKLQSPLAVEGELPEAGLDAYGDDGDDLMLALARKIVAGDGDAGSVESVFAQAQRVAAEAEALLVDAEWAASEPVAEAVPVSAAANDGRADSGEPQISLCLWGEFMAGETLEPEPGGDGTRLPRSPSSSGRSNGNRRARSPLPPRNGRAGRGAAAKCSGVPQPRPCAGVSSAPEAISGRELCHKPEPGAAARSGGRPVGEKNAARNDAPRLSGQRVSIENGSTARPQVASCCTLGPRYIGGQCDARCTRCRRVRCLRATR